MKIISNNTTTAVIHQPYFLPWMGYFSKLVYADNFIVLDDVLFSKRKYIDRVKIINAQGELMWIGLPIGQQFKNPCNKIYFSDKRHVNKIIKSFYASYSKARYFKQNILQIEKIIKNSFCYSEILSEINIKIVESILLYLEYRIPTIIRSSQYPEIKYATERVIMLCNETNSNSLILGSDEIDKHEYEKYITNNIQVLIQDYFTNHPTYYQTRRTKLGFAKGLSIVDCIFNEGVEKTRQLVENKDLKLETYQIIQNIES